METKELGMFIAKRRTELGMTQVQLAERLHVTNKAIYKCIPVIMIAWGLMFTFIYVMCMYMDLGQHLELRAILIGFLVLEAGLTGNILNTLVRRE